METEKQSFTARAFALRPFPWDVRAAVVALLFTGLGIVGLCFASFYSAMAVEPALAGRKGALHDELLTIGVAGVCAYHAVVGTIALRTSYGKAGNAAERRAWNSAAMFALFGPLLGALTFWALSVGLRPFPSQAGVISAPVERYWEEGNRNKDGVVFHLKLRGSDRVFNYDCMYGSHGPWCSAHSALQAAIIAPPPHQAQVIPVGDGMAMLSLDGRKVLDWKSEQWEQRYLPLLGGIGTGLLFAFSLVTAIAWAKRAATIHAKVVATRAADQPPVIE